jgi:hypothetical protein
MKVAQLAITNRRLVSSQPPPYGSLPASGLPPSQQIQPPFPASLPISLTVEQRVQLSRNHAQLRLDKSSFLSDTMAMTQGKCGRCFVTTGALLDHAPFLECPDDTFIVPGDWLRSVKSLFKFEPFTYCYNCGTPQDNRGAREAPDCHRKWKYKSGQHCPWADFIFIAVWSIWNVPVRRDAFLLRFGLPPSTGYEEFAKWLVLEDALGGKYYNGLEMYVWYCQQWLKTGIR